jgi:AcrR family transcriptional regulator
MKSSARDGASRRQAIVRSLVSVFKRDGYAGASLTDLSGACGLAKASLYHRFPEGKPEMGRTALADEGRRFTDLILRPLQRGGSGAERLSLMLAGVLAFYADEPPACLMNTLTLGEGDALFRSTIGQTIEAWIKAMTAALDQDGRDVATAEALARDVVVRVQGALVLARLTGRESALIEALGRCADDLGVVPPVPARS